MSKKLFDYATKRIKESVMSNENYERSRHADSVIRNHMVWSMGMSLVVTVPIADIFAVGAIQLDMIRQLCKVYEKDFSETSGKAIVTSLTSSTLARTGARSLIKLIPGVGTIIGGVAVSIFNGASTYALGEVFKKHFESGGTILDFDTERLKKVYKEKFEKGKKVAEQLKKEDEGKKKPESIKVSGEPTEAKTDAEPAAGKTAPKSMDQEEVLVRLKELASLRDQGIISEEEFQSLKKKLIEAF